MRLTAANCRSRDDCVALLNSGKYLLKSMSYHKFQNMKCVNVMPGKVKVAPRSCREEEDREDISMTPDSSHSPLDYDELGIGNMDSWTNNDVREGQTYPPCC